MSATAPFSVVAAFAENPNAGNPAAIVYVDLDQYPNETYGKLSQNFNHPMTAFVSPKPRPESTEKVLHYDIRYFAPNTMEVPLCGHATLAAAQAILKTEHASEAVEAFEFHTTTRGDVTVWRRPGGFLELSLVAQHLLDPDRGQYSLMMRVLKNTFLQEVAVNYIGMGGRDMTFYLLVELDEKENLKDLVFNTAALKETGRILHIFTQRCSTGPERFRSRVILPPAIMSGDEDPVCGTAHSILTPYWSKKLEIPRGTEISAKQVSARGGDLRLVWDADVEKVHLKAKMAELAHGEVFISS